MSESPRPGPSEPRSRSVGFLSERDQERVHFAKSLSQHKLQYTSVQKTPMTPTSSPRSSSLDSDHNPTKACVADTETSARRPESPPLSTNNDQSEKPRNRLAALYQKYNPQKIFENRGNTARDHLASERTFLAYVRTSLALASTGVALVQLFTVADLSNSPQSEANKRLQKFARPLGVTAVVMSLAMLGIAVHRYFLIQFALPGNMFPVARISVIFMTFVLSAMIVVIFAAIVGGRT